MLGNNPGKGIPAKKYNTGYNINTNQGNNMIRKLKQQLNDNIPVQLIVTKRTQIYSNHNNWTYITSRHPDSPYPMLQDPNTHLNKGDILRVIGLGQLPGCVPSVLVEAPNGSQAHIFLKNLSKYTKF